MAEYIVMPKLGFDMREGVLNTWLKKIGDPVSKGEVVAEIESDKATLELESQVTGTLLQLLHQAGDVVPVGANMAIVGHEGESLPSLTGDKGSGETVEAKASRDHEPVVVSPSAPSTGSPASAEKAMADETYPGGVKATPVARRLAEEKQIDLLDVRGSGPDGRITKADVEAFVVTPKLSPAVTMTTPSISPATVEAGPESEEIALTRLRQAIGRRMVESKTTVPHFYVTTEIDMAPVLELRKQVNATLSDDQKVSVNDLVVKAAALAVRDFPNLNAAFAGDKIIRHKRVNIGSAVAVEGGLTTIVQKDTDISSLSKVATDNRAMIARAREGKVRPDDVEGGTFTVSNLGVYDVDHFIAIINPPEAAILAVGSAREVPVVKDGQLGIGTRMKATISADHRVTDGAEAAQFMQRLKELLEKPLRLLV